MTTILETILFKKGVWVKLSSFQWKICHLEQNKLSYDDLRAREWEAKETTNSVPKTFQVRKFDWNSYQKFVFASKPKCFSEGVGEISKHTNLKSSWNFYFL